MLTDDKFKPFIDAFRNMRSDIKSRTKHAGILKKRVKKAGEKQKKRDDKIAISSQSGLVQKRRVERHVVDNQLK